MLTSAPIRLQGMQLLSMAFKVAKSIVLRFSWETKLAMTGLKLKLNRLANSRVKMGRSQKVARRS